MEPRSGTNHGAARVTRSKPPGRKRLRVLKGETGTLRTGAAPAVPRADPATGKLQPRSPAESLLQEEKDRWAYEIHDGLTQVVAAAILQLETLARRIAFDPTSAAAQLEETTTRMREAMADVRSVLFELSAGTAADETASNRLRACVHEALTNAAKHSTSGEVRVLARVGSRRLSVRVEDHGCGSESASKRFGMRMMERRVQEIGGTLQVASMSRGTRVTVGLPLGGRHP